MTMQPHNGSPIKANETEEVVLRISRKRLRQLMQNGQLVASDFTCTSNCAKCVVRELLLECAGSDLAAND